MFPAARSRSGRDRTLRLRELILLAAAFNGWTLRQLSRALERDPSKLLPDSGAPKMDLIVRLADSLGWSVDDLLSHLNTPVSSATSDRRSAAATGDREHPDGGLDDEPPADHGTSPAEVRRAAASAASENVDREQSSELRPSGGSPTASTPLDGPVEVSGGSGTSATSATFGASGVESHVDSFDPAVPAERRVPPNRTTRAIRRDEFTHACRGGTALAAPPSDEAAAAIVALHAAAHSKLRSGRHAQAISGYRAALHAAAALEAPRDLAYRPELLLGLADAHHRLGEAIEGRAIAGEALAAARWVEGGRTALLAARSLLLRAVCARDLLESRTGDIGAPVEDALCDVAAAERFVVDAPHAHQPRAHEFQSQDLQRRQRQIHGRQTPEQTCEQGLDERQSFCARRSRMSGDGAEDGAGAAQVIAHRAVGLRLELEALREPSRGPAALARILAELDAVVDVEAVSHLPMLESHGWWCVSGFAIARRHLRGATLHRTLGILSNKVDEIASRVDSWPLRERVLLLEHERRERLVDDGGSPGAWLLDHEDVRTIVGCIGGSRRFRTIGLAILRGATLVDSTELPALVRRRL